MKIHAQYDWTTGVLDNGNACAPCVPLFVHCLIRVEAEGLLDYQGRAGIISIVRWNLRPVIFGATAPSAILSRKGFAPYGGVSRAGPLRLVIHCCMYITATSNDSVRPWGLMVAASTSLQPRMTRLDLGQGHCGKICQTLGIVQNQ